MNGRARHRRTGGPGGIALLTLLVAVGAIGCLAGPRHTDSPSSPVVLRPTEPEVLAPPTPVGGIGTLFGEPCEMANPLCEQAARNLLQPRFTIGLRPDGTPGLVAGFLVDGRRHWVFHPEAELDSLFRASASNSTPGGAARPGKVVSGAVRAGANDVLSAPSEHEDAGCGRTTVQ